ncbi:MAG: ribonuclease M5 [Firmicutes bacterium]|nr:ribonuclease M5 [Bacillota bacterium]
MDHEKRSHVVSRETMTKTTIREVIVVEGRTDVVFLESFLDAEIVSTNGSDVPRETIDYLSALSKTKKIIVLTDPDSPGKRIRDILDKEIPNLFHAFVPKSKAIKKHKVGIAESSPEEVLKALEHLVTFDKDSLGNLTMEDLFELELVGHEDSFKNREIISQKFHLGFGNGKTILKRLNCLKITGQQIAETLKEIKP